MRKNDDEIQSRTEGETDVGRPERGTDSIADRIIEQYSAESVILVSHNICQNNKRL